MSRRTVGTIALAAGVAAVVVVRKQRRAASGPAGGGTSATRTGWLGVTVNRTPEDVRITPALDRLGDDVEVDVRPAPGDKGTEIRARYRSRASSERPGPLRAALREAKQFIEVGDVLRVDPQPHGHRKPTPAGLLVEKAASRSNEGGVL